MNKQAKSFLRSAVILTLASAMVIAFMEEWGAVQAVIALLLALLTAGQWALFIYLKRK